jgi:hypothetical protein
VRDSTKWRRRFAALLQAGTKIRIFVSTAPAMRTAAFATIAENIERRWYRVRASTESVYVFAKVELKLIVYTSSFSGQVRAGRTAFTDVGLCLDHAARTMGRTSSFDRLVGPKS